jgi:N6-adenosine-specific RNA methylase IME4
MADDLIKFDDGGRLQLGLFTLHSTGLIIRGKPSFDEWARMGAFLHAVEKANHWWIGDWLLYGEGHYQDRVDQVINSDDGWNEQTVKDDRWVALSVSESRRRDALSFSHHKEVAEMQPEDQDVWLQRAEEGQWNRAELRMQIRLSKRTATTASGTMGDGPFRVVYADPPWHYDSGAPISRNDNYGPAERHYPTLTVEEIAAVPVKDRVEDDAVLFLWVTSPLLSSCWPVIDGWGFEYKTSIVWDKVAHNYGHYVSVRHELLLVCTRGSCTPDQPTPMPDSVITIKRSDTHSEKPEEFRQLIDRLYPLGQALEVFGRKPLSGRWTVYGNQLLGVGA